MHEKRNFYQHFVLEAPQKNESFSHKKGYYFEYVDDDVIRVLEAVGVAALVEDAVQQGEGEDGDRT